MKRVNLVMVFDWATQSPYTGGNVIFIETYRGYDIYFLDHWGLMFYAIVDPDGVELNIFHSTLSYIKSYIDSIAPEPGEPYTQITDFIVPTSLPAGAPIGELTVVTWNAGTAAGYLFVTINSDKYTVAAGSSYPTQVAPGDTFTFYLTPEIEPNMPDQDYTLTATNYEGTSQISRTILVEVGIPTTTTLSVPSKIAVDEKFFISGILYETEAGIPIPNQPINHSYDGRSLGGSTTGVDGDYLKEVSVPETGVWTLKSDFPGTEGLQASRSLAGTVVATTPIATALQIAGSIATGLALFIYGIR